MHSTQLLLLCTSTPTSVAVRAAQDSLKALLDAHKVEYTVVDCGEPEHKELRNAAWAISGKRVVYPQAFTRAGGAGGALAFVGDWDSISALSESNSDLKGLDAALAGLPRRG